MLVTCHVCLGHGCWAEPTHSVIVPAGPTSRRVSHSAAACLRRAWQQEAEWDCVWLCERSATCGSKRRDKSAVGMQHAAAPFAGHSRPKMLARPALAAAPRPSGSLAALLASQLVRPRSSLAPRGRRSHKCGPAVAPALGLAAEPSTGAAAPEAPHNLGSSLGAVQRDRTAEASTSDQGSARAHTSSRPSAQLQAVPHDKRAPPTPLDPGPITDMSVIHNAVILVDKPLGWTRRAGPRPCHDAGAFVAVDREVTAAARLLRYDAIQSSRMSYHSLSPRSFDVCGKVRNLIRYLAPESSCKRGFRVSDRQVFPPSRLSATWLCGASLQQGPQASIIMPGLQKSRSVTPGSVYVQVGHAGTLDPQASGLLIVCTGKGTKWCDDFQAQASTRASLDSTPHRHGRSSPPLLFRPAFCASPAHLQSRPLHARRTRCTPA
jgi:hypothetical protein